MKFKRVPLETCSEATGTVVVIDVLRAFTCAAFAFSAGAKEIILVQETADFILDHAPDRVTFVITGLGENGLGDEDLACADYLEVLLQGHQPDPEPFLRRVRESVVGQHFLSPDYPELPAEDIPCCTDLDRFDFAMPVRRKNDLLVMKPV